jgi:hypothetical protein
MKVYKWLSRYGSAVNAWAIIEVEPGEPADIEWMMQVLDGNTGNYGMRATLLSVDKPPEMRWNARLKMNTPDTQFGFPGGKTLQGHTRYYEAFLNRD